MNDMAAFDGAGAAIVQFEPAARKGSHTLLGLYGFSGCGKTLSAIYIARGLVGDDGKVAMIDTETGRGLIYAMEAGGYDYAELTPPFTPERYTDSIKAAEAAGVDCLIIDSSSHEWEGIGGVLEMAEAGGGKGLVKWANPKARHKKFVQSMLNSRMHIILCARAKEKMIQVTAANQRKYPRAKVGDIFTEGMVAIQEKRFIYEMTVQIFLPIPDDPEGPRGVPVLEKCPKDLLGGFPPGEQISIATGQRIAEWVSGGEPVDQSAQDLKREAEDMASFGTERMRAWWGGLSKAQQRQLQGNLPNLRSIAQTADDEQARQKTTDEEANAVEDDRLADPFGHDTNTTGGDQSEETEEQEGDAASKSAKDSSRGTPQAADGAGETPAAPDPPADHAKWKAPHWREWSKRSIADIADYDDEGELRAWFDADVAPVCKANMDASRNEGAAVLNAYNERLAVLQGEAVGAA